MRLPGAMATRLTHLGCLWGPPGPSCCACDGQGPGGSCLDLSPIGVHEHGYAVCPRGRPLWQPQAVCPGALCAWRGCIQTCIHTHAQGSHHLSNCWGGGLSRGLGSVQLRGCRPRRLGAAVEGSACVLPAHTVWGGLWSLPLPWATALDSFRALYQL